MPAQRHRIVNITRHEVLEPSLMGSPDVFSGLYSHPVFSGLYSHPAAMGGLLHLLANDWVGERVLIIGESADDDELPGSSSWLGIPASKLYSPTRAGQRRYTHVSKKLREEMSECYEFAFAVDKTTSSRVTSSGTEVTKSTSVQAERPNPFVMADLMDGDTVPVVVLNEDKMEILRPEALGHGEGAGLNSLVINPSFSPSRGTAEMSGRGMLPAALAFLLSPSRAETIYLPSHSGRWAMDKITVLPAELLEGSEGITDVSADIKSAMAGHSELDAYMAHMETAFVA